MNMKGNGLKSATVDEALSIKSELDSYNHATRFRIFLKVLAFLFVVIFAISKQYILAVLILFSSLILIKKQKNRLRLAIWFGLPGSGKTTIAAAISKKSSLPTYANFPLAGAYKLDPLKDLGVYDIQDAQIIIDEAGIEYNNRSYKSMPKENIEWLKYHRHAGCSVDVFSQSYDDMDITLRRLAYELYFVRRSRIPGVVTALPIRRSIDIDKTTHQIVDAYSFDPALLRPFTARRFIGKKYWNMFDTYSLPEYNKKEFTMWEVNHEEKEKENTPGVAFTTFAVDPSRDSGVR